MVSEIGDSTRHGAVLAVWFRRRESGPFFNCVVLMLDDERLLSCGRVLTGRPTRHHLFRNADGNRPAEQAGLKFYQTREGNESKFYKFTDVLCELA